MLQSTVYKSDRPAVLELRPKSLRRTGDDFNNLGHTNNMLP